MTVIRLCRLRPSDAPESPTSVGGLDLEGFYAGIGCSEEAGGRPAFDPQLLISLWIYAYSQGIGSAREVGRRCEWEPALQCRMGPLDASTSVAYRRHPYFATVEGAGIPTLF